MEGYVYLWRTLMAQPWYQNPKTVQLFIHLLLSASHKPREQIYRKKVVNLREGSFWTTHDRLASALNLGVQSIRTSLEHLKLTNTITCQSDRQGMIIILNNWIDWQSPTNKLTTDQQTTNKRLTNDQQQNNTLKNEKNEKNVYAQTFDEFWKVYPRKDAKKKALKAFTSLKPSNELFQSILTHVLKMSKTEKWLENDGMYIPYASSYLNGHRWEDEVPRTRTWQEEFDERQKAKGVV
jgi:hypothetical protein